MVSCEFGTRSSTEHYHLHGTHIVSAFLFFVFVVVVLNVIGLLGIDFFFWSTLSVGCIVRHTGLLVLQVVL